MGEMTQPVESGRQAEISDLFALRTEVKVRIGEVILDTNRLADDKKMGSLACWKISKSLLDIMNAL